MTQTQLCGKILTGSGVEMNKKHTHCGEEGETE